MIFNKTHLLLYNNCIKKNSNPLYRNNTTDDRGLLLPFLVGAAVAFPIGYIASNTNKNQYQMYPMQYPQYPIYPQYQQYPMYYPQQFIPY